MCVLWTISSCPAAPLEWFTIIDWFHLRSKGWQYLWPFLLARGSHQCCSHLRDRSASSSDTANDYYPIYFTSQTCDKSHSNDSTDFLKSSLFEICLSHNFIVTRYTISFGNSRHDLLGSLFCFPVRIYFLCSSLQLIFPRHTWQPYLWGNLSVLYIGKGTQTHCRCPQGDN